MVHFSVSRGQTFFVKKKVFCGKQPRKATKESNQGKQPRKATNESIFLEFWIFQID